MPSTYSGSLRFELIGTGEQTGTWGTTANRNFGTLLEQAVCGVLTLPMLDVDQTLSTVNGNTDQARNAVIVATGSMSAVRSIIAPNVTKNYIVRNATTGGFNVQIKTAGGVAVSVAPGQAASVFCDGADFYLAQASPTLTSQNITDALGYIPYNSTNPSGFITAAGLSAYATLASPNFTGTPTAPTQPNGTNNQSLATTAYVVSAVTAATTGVVSFNTRTGAVVLNSGDVASALGYTPYNAANPAGYITSATAPVQSVFGRTGAVSLQASDVTTALGFTPYNASNPSGYITITALSPYAALASPTFTGVPSAPTATTGTNTTQIATTQFVQTAISASVSGVSSFNTRTGAVTLTLADVTTALAFTPPQQGNGVGQTTNAVKIGWSAGARLKVTVDSTDLGNVLFDGMSNALLANGAGYITAAGAPVQSYNGRVGAIVPQAADVTSALGYTPFSTAGGLITGSITVGSGATGVVYLGNSGARYVYFDGTYYQMPSSALVLGGRLFANGGVGNGIGSIYSQNGGSPNAPNPGDMCLIW